MASRLDAFLRPYIDRPFAWGTDDCSLFLADWWQYTHGTDPAAHLRGTYDSAEGKAAIVTAAGGIVHLVERVAATAGAALTAPGAVQPGDFGIIAPGVGAIWDGVFWVARAETGLLYTREARVWRVWSL